MALQDRGQEHADDDSVRDHDDRLAPGGIRDPLKHRQHASLDVGERLTPRVGEFDVARHPALLCLGVGGEPLLAAEPAERPHPALVQVGLDPGFQAARTGNRHGRLDRPAHGRGVNCRRPLRGQNDGNRPGLSPAPLAQAHVRLGPVKPVRGRRLGVPEQQNSTFLQKTCPHRRNFASCGGETVPSNAITAVPTCSHPFASLPIPGSSIDPGGPISQNRPIVPVRSLYG